MSPHLGTALWQPTGCTSLVHCSSLQPVLESESTWVIASPCPVIAAWSAHPQAVNTLHTLPFQLPLWSISNQLRWNCSVMETDWCVILFETFECFGSSMIVSQPPLLSSKTSPSPIDFEQQPSGSQCLTDMMANRHDDIIDLTKPNVRAVANALHGVSFPESEYEVIDLTAE
jgi:hypothetical protein